VIGGGHSWPGREREVLFFNLGNPTLELDATLETWKFFKNIEK
jgi:poly(3-hydroxybutyrate) depolymerase